MKIFRPLFVVLLIFAILNSGTKKTIAQVPTKKILIEEFTGEWCGWCPIGMMELENMKEKYGDTIILVAVHTGDPLEVQSASAMIGAWAGSAPSALINREYDDVIGSQVLGTESWDEAIARQINTPAPCNVTLVYSYNETTREIVATVAATFVENYIGDSRLNLYIVEDNVVGASQSNYLSGNNEFANTPFYSLPEHITNFSHQHVLRDMVGESYGIDDIIPDTVQVGQQFAHTFNYSIPENYKLDDLHIIGVAQLYKGLKKYRKILNSTHQKFYTGGTGLNQLSSVSALIISPNPAENFINVQIPSGESIQAVKIFSTDGSLMFHDKASNSNLHINIQSLKTGCFIIVVETGKNVYRQKFIVNK